MAWLASACSIQEDIQAVSFTAPSDRSICIVDHPATRASFRAEYERHLQARGYQTRIIPANSPLNTYPKTTTYIARWSWDLTIYMSYAVILVYENGQPVGSVTYDARRGGGRLDKFVDAETKIAELVAQLFPT